MTAMFRLPAAVRRLEPAHWVWIMAFALSGFSAYYWDATAPSSITAETVESAATLIPAGFVLVPIEVANYESLDSILGKFGTVDLFIPGDETNRKARKVASHVRMLRAPLNPGRFAVLVPENESSSLVTHGGPFVVTVQNPRFAGTGRAFPASNDASVKRRSRITVEVTSGMDQ